MRAPSSVWGLLLLSALFLSSDNTGSGTNAMEVSFCRMIQRVVDREGAARHCILHNPRALAPRVETGWTDVNATQCRAFQRWIAGKEMLFPMLNVPAATASLSTSIFHSCDGRGRRVTSVVYCRGVTKGSGNVLEQRECSHRPQRNRSECSGEIESSMSMSLKSLPFCRCMRRRRG
jgi:hypothetical protein